MKLRIKIASAVAALAVVSAVLAQTMEKCPIDKTNMGWTGNTRQEMGKTLLEYKCIYDHIYWIVKH